MIRLETTTRKLQVLLGGAVTTNELPIVASYRDELYNFRPNYHPGGATDLVNTTGATPVDIVPAPENGRECRIVEYVSIRNRDTTSATVTVRYNNDGTTYEIVKIILSVDDTLTYTPVAGWFVIDANGRVKQSTNVNVPGTTTDNAVARWDGAAGAALQNSALVVDDDGDITSFGGQIKFPATQSASSDANTLDDYEEGDFTPTFDFDTTGNLSNSYTTQVGTYEKVGRMFWFMYRLVWTPTHTTSSGNARFDGLPFTSENTTDMLWTVPISNLNDGFTWTASRTMCAGEIAANTARFNIRQLGSAANSAVMGTSNVVTGTAKALTCSGFALATAQI